MCCRNCSAPKQRTKRSDGGNRTETLTYLAGGVKGTETSSHPHGRDLLVEDGFLHLRRQLMRMPMREK